MSDPSSAAFLTEEVLPLITRQMPLRFGLVPLIPQDEAAAQKAIAAALCTWHLVEAYGKKDSMAFLTSLSEEEALTVDAIKERFDAIIGVPDVALKSGAEQLDYEAVLASESLGGRLGNAISYSKRLALRAEEGSGHAFLNGQYLRADETFRMVVQQALGPQMQFLQQKIYFGELSNSNEVSTFFYDLPDTLPRRNAFIPPTADRPVRFVEDYTAVFEHRGIRKALQRPNADNVTETVFVVGDFAQKGARDLGKAVLYGLSELTSRRVYVLDNPPAHSDAGALGEVMHFIMQVLTWSFQQAGFDEHFASLPTAADYGRINRDSPEDRRMVEALGIQSGQTALVINGRILPDLPAGAFDAEDIESLLTFERKRRLDPVLKAVAAAGIDLSKHDVSRYADFVASASAIVATATMPNPAHGMFETTSLQRTRDYRAIEGNYSLIQAGDIETAYLQIGVILDPISETAQKWSALLQELSRLSSVYLEVFLNPRHELREVPVKRFYRHSFQSRLTFDETGAIEPPTIAFENLPESALLTLAVDVPNAWLAFPKRTRHDLDNIRLSDLSASARQAGIHAVFELENLIIEAHARDMPSSQPPRGLQLDLKSIDSQIQTDSLVMANLGYVQLKANPGVWALSIRDGRSTEVFAMESVGSRGFNSPAINQTGSSFAITTFEGLTLYPTFLRRPGQEFVDLLSDETTLKAKSPSVNLFERLQGFFSSQKNIIAPVKGGGAEINIFTVASGLLYERMALIMIVSVLRHTNSTCKFWFIQNFLSPSFKAFMPHMAQEYGFEYEFITFKWPHWLRTQKEKQRFIWGYKILFLDVLFPLELKRVIFVDSDQIVRTDLKQLVVLDLQGAPYGYTPMGDDREETEGYRFWKTGYWKDHLAGRPYHISALYVIDLDQFRAIGAGDRLRAQYQALSSDPNSLANLDQDLPNNVQAMIPIYSLDRSWLWCETWCSDESLAEAKTIDLCNNPMTHEPKLQRAKRLIPEWTVYDDEIAALAKRIAEASRSAEAEAFAENAEKLGQAREQVKEFIEEGTGGDAGAEGLESDSVDVPVTIEKREGHLEGEL